MTRRPRVSVVLPTFNAGAHVADAIRSIQLQTFEDVELLVMDGGSTDDTRTIVKALAAKDARIRLHTARRSSLVASLNKGCRIAVGEFIARMDADDLALPDRFAKQVAFLDSNDTVGVLGSWVLIVNEGGTPKHVRTYPVDSDELAWTVRLACPLAHAAVMIRRDLLRTVTGPYRESARYAEDFDLWARLADQTRLANLPEALLVRREHPGNVSAVHVDAQADVAARTVQDSLSRWLGREVPDQVAADLADAMSGRRLASSERLQAAGRLLEDCAAHWMEENGERRPAWLRRDLADRYGQLSLAGLAHSKIVAARWLARAGGEHPMRTARRVLQAVTRQFPLAAPQDEFKRARAAHEALSARLHTP